MCIVFTDAVHERGFMFDFSSVRFIAILLLLLSSGCRLVRSGTLDGESLTQPSLEELDGAGPQVPASLWSPAQRESTAAWYFLAAEMMTLRGQLDKALPVLEAAYNLDPNALTGGKMIAVKATVGDREEALAEGERMVLLYPKDDRMRLLYAEMLAASRKIPEAVTQLRKAIEIGTELDQVHLMLSALLFQDQSSRAEALRVVQNFLKAKPASVVGLVQLTKMHLSSGNKKDAVAPAKRAWEIDSQNPEIALLYAIALEVNNRSKDAMQLYEQLYRLNPSNEELTARMVQIYRELGDMDDALALLEDASRSSDKMRPGLLMQKAIVLWELKRNTEADQLLTQLLGEMPESDRVLYMAGLGKERVEQFESAVALYAKIPQGSPLKPGADVRRAMILLEAKRFSEAEALVRPLIEQEDSSPEVWVALASILDESGTPADAADLMDQAYRRFPDQGRTLFLRGVFEEKSGQIAKAMATMREVIKLEPNNSSALNFLGYMMAERGENLDEAEKLIRRALAIKPRDGFYLDSLGWVWFQRGDLQKAQQFLEQALELEPEEGVILEHLGDVWARKGDHQKALQYYERAAKGKLEDRDRKRILPKLEEWRKNHGSSP
jgi:tetratricopeptide (TPR) repeat protein